MSSCVRCVYSTINFPGLKFDEDGVCASCREYDRQIQTRVLTGPEGQEVLRARIASIRQAGQGRPYDCVIGLSGGVDSTYVALLAREHGLRPLAVHLDNGWNTAIAVSNVERTLRSLDLDLVTHVIRWNEFRDLQVAFLRASTPDGEIPTDHAIQATMWQTAARFGIQTIISGMNFQTESPTNPSYWAYGHSDWLYIKDVHRRFGNEELTSYPHYTLPKLLTFNVVKGIRTLSILNYAPYDKDAAKRRITKELGWQDYGGKHHESVYTRFFQGHILPTKFGIDKRLAHLSDLIRLGQITRSEAISELTQPPYPQEQQELDLIYVLKKLELSSVEFEQLMAAPVRSHRDFRNQEPGVRLLKRAVNLMRSRGQYHL